MKPLVPSDVEIAKEALAVLMQHMPASKVARLLTALQIGQGDYVKMRENLFADETVESLFKKVSERQD